MHPDQGQPVDNLAEKRISAVVCESCGRLHRYTAETWITLYGGWEQVQKPQRYVRDVLYQNTFGTKDNPKVVCRQWHCIGKAMALENDD